MKRQDYEAALKEKYGDTRMARMKTPQGYAYFRQPTEEEYDEYQRLGAGASEEGVTMAFRRYVSQCFVGHHPERALDDVCKDIGPGALGGPMGAVVNELAGVNARPFETF